MAIVDVRSDSTKVGAPNSAARSAWNAAHSESTESGEPKSQCLIQTAAKSPSSFILFSHSFFGDSTKEARNIVHLSGA